MPKTSAYTRGNARTVKVNDLGNLPALMSTKEYAAITGLSLVTIANKCKRGQIPAVKCGREWRINTTKALRALGLAD